MMKTKRPSRTEDESLDTFYHGRILVLQKKRGYRFSVDAPLLADFIQTGEHDSLLELGTGTGIISLLLSIKPFRRIVALEIQASLASLARRNVQLNGLEDRIVVLCQDLRDYHPGEKFDVIFSNPPYIRKQGGQLSSSSEKSIAKHELSCDIFDIMRKTGELLNPEGRSYLIFPAEREEDLREAVERSRLKIRTLRYVHSRRHESPNLLLAECGFRSAGKSILPPLILYGEKGRYTREAEQIFRGREGVAHL
jgi:tRNA1(Val) A37 N6-methylase TrmN6